MAGPLINLIFTPNNSMLVAGLVRLSLCARFRTHSAQLDIPPGRNEAELTVTEHDVRLMFKSVNISEATGPDGVTGRV